jgi:hypothetical protein
VGFDVFAGAGAIKSTAADMLTYLDANLHPEKYATASDAANSPVATLPSAFAIDYELRVDAPPIGKIALAWFLDSDHNIWHDGGTGGYNSYAEFNLEKDRAIVVLYNRMSFAIPLFATRVGENVRELMSGEPSIPLDYISDDERQALIPPTFSENSIEGPYRCTLAAFPLPATIKDPFTNAASGDIHVTADGKGNLSDGTRVHHIQAPHLDLTCKLKMVSGRYSLTRDGTGTQTSSWKLVVDESPRGCFQFFSPARPPVTTDSELIVKDTEGKAFYTTSINPFAVLTTVCQREAAT